MPFALRLIPAAAAAFLLVSCGGGSGSKPDPDGPGATPSGGVAVDGYLSGATVLCDSNGNGTADAGERSVGTSASGSFTFAAGCTAGLVVTGGTSVDTGLPFGGALRAPAGATVVSPLTTLIAAGMTQAQLLTALGLPSDTPDLLNTDPAATDTEGAPLRPALLKQTLAVQQLTQKTAELFAGLAGVDDAASLRSLYGQVADAFAGTLAGGAPLLAGTTMDPAVVAALVKAAATSDALGEDVTAALSALNTDSLAQVTAGGLVSQAEGILNAADGDIPTVTEAAQRNTAITDFVDDNAGALAGPPSEDTAALAQQLADQANPAPTDFLALAGDAIALVSGATTTPYTMAAFQSTAGISLKWPVASTTVVKVDGVEVGSYAIPTGRKLTAAIEITETAAGGQGKLLGFIENVDVRKTGSGLEIQVPAFGAGANAQAYGMSSDGSKQTMIDFSQGVGGVQHTLRIGSSNTLVFGNVIGYAVNQVSNDFTNITALRGKYMVRVVVNGLPLRKADGSALPVVTIDVPTALNGNGDVTTTKPVTGSGLVGYVTLTD